MNENNTNRCFNNLSFENKQLWLNINQNVKTINLFKNLDKSYYVCVHCLKHLETDTTNENFSCYGNCFVVESTIVYCDDCIKHFNLETKYSSVTLCGLICPVCWYFQIKDCDNCSNHDYFSFSQQCCNPSISLDQWKTIDLNKVLQCYEKYVYQCK